MDDNPLAEAYRLIEAARGGEHGWSRPYGGPEAVAREADRLRLLVEAAASDLMAVRSAAIGQLLEEESLRTVEKRIGLSRSAISKADRAWRALPAFPKLIDEESW